MSKDIKRVRLYPIKRIAAPPRTKVIEKFREPQVIERYHIDIKFQDELETKLKVVLFSFDRAEKKVFGISRQFSAYKWYMQYRWVLAKKGKKKKLKNKYYNTVVKIADWLYNQCTGYTNLLSYVAYDYGCTIASLHQRRFQGKPYFINGYSTTLWNKQEWDKFKAKHLEREGDPYFLMEKRSRERSTGKLSTISGHFVLEREVDVKVKELLKTRKILREQVKLAKISDEYIYAEVSVVDVSSRKRVLKKVLRKG